MREEGSLNRFKKRGKFSLSFDVLEKHRDLVLKVQAKVVILKAEVNVHFGRVDYLGVCDEFEPALIYRETPEYGILFIKDKEGNINVKFKKE